MKQPVLIFLAGGVGLAASSCSVYAPMLPVAPQIREKGQAEVQGTSFLNGRWEVGATYSPVRNLLVRATGSWKNPGQDTSFYRSRQFEVGAGGYLPLSKRWLLTGLAGYGRARSTRSYYSFSLLTYDGPHEYRSRYHKVFGEVSGSYRAESEWVTLGAAYRLTQVRFEQLTFDGVPLHLRSMLRAEPLLFARFGNEESPLRWLQIQAAVGATSIPGYHPSYNTEPAEYRRVKEGRGFATLSLIIRPHLFALPPSTPPASL